jgi:pimeloyl-ACP methyl ester carboxylesterase
MMGVDEFASSFSGGEIWEQDVGDLTLRGRWIEHPSSAAPVIHFVHGNGFAGDMYAPCLTPLLKYASLFTHDMQGHGLSDSGANFVGLELSAARIGTVIGGNSHFFGDRKRIAIGHSFGAMLTLRYAAENPGAFDAVVLLDPVLLNPEQVILAQRQYDAGESLSPLANQALQRGTDWPNREAAFDYFNGRKSLSTWHHDGLEAYINAVLECNSNGSCSLRCPPWMEAAIFSQRPADHWPAIRSLTNPTLAIYGKQSLAFLEPNLCQAAAQNAYISVVGANGGHCFTQEHPESLVTLLQNYPPVATLLNVAPNGRHSG